MIAPKVSLESHVVPLSLSREFVILHHFVRIWVLSRVVIDVLDLLVQLALKHAHCFDRMLEHILGEFLASPAQIVNVNFQPVVFVRNEIVYFLPHLSSVEIISNVSFYLILGDF